MEKILIFYGPSEAFYKFEPKSYYPLEALVRLSDLRNKTFFLDDTDMDNVVAFTMSYSGITAEGIQNFINILSAQKVKNLFLQNPPDVIKEELYRHYGSDIIQEKYYEYKTVNFKQLEQFVKEFDSVIIGQKKIKMKIASALYDVCKKRNEDKPVVLMFYGPSGVGKTETAKYIATLLDEKICRFQLSMYQTNSFYDYLFGSEHGKSSFAKDLMERESNIILFDEFDKAHPGIWSAFYEFFDEGIYRDKNYTVNIDNAIIICTTNEKTPDMVRSKIGDPLFFRINQYIAFSELSEDAKKIICTNIFNEEYNKLDTEERKLISYNKFLERYLKALNNFVNYRQIKNIIKNDLSQKLVESIFKVGDEKNEEVEKNTNSRGSV